ncbi:MAG: hypothetical protein H7296_10580 [Bacteroidia bacterium]|nr:hypothetical protein [Bacteroidia bacterium]
MKKFTLLSCLCFLGFNLFAQFGNFKKRADLETFKDTKLIVVLFPDSAYSYSLMAAIEKYWTFTGFEFAEDTAMQRYRKGDYAFMYFSKSKGSKNKSKVASSEQDFNGLVITRKFSRRVLPDNLLAYAYCGNKIDTGDWEIEMIRAVQLMNNYFNYAIQAKNDGEIGSTKMMNNYPTDKNLLVDKKLLIETGQLDMKGSKEDAMTSFDGDAEEVEMEEIHKAIKNQDNSFLYYYHSKDEKYCNKLVVSAANSELMYFESAAPDKCKCTSKDLKALKTFKIKAAKSVAD